MEIDSRSSSSRMDQQRAQALFDKGGFFLLQDLPQRSEFGVDGALWQVNKFSGVRFSSETFRLSHLQR
jgi:A1 cistron-splicing factor AAR2